MHNKQSKKISLRQLTEEFIAQEVAIAQGGGDAGKERQKQLGRMTARERVAYCLDKGKPFFELGIWSAHKMYEQWGDLPAAGVITGIGYCQKRPCMVIANDATTKAGAMFPQSVKKVLRAQRIAYMCRLPILYFVDSSGVFLPLQDEIFPDEDDFGRIFRNNAILSAQGIPQYAAIMGNCIAGGGYLPVLCDKLLMTEGSGLYLAGPALVKAAIGHTVTSEELGGAKMHAEISGTIDFYEKDDASCLDRMRSLVDLLPEEKFSDILDNHHLDTQRHHLELYDIIGADNTQEYDVKDVCACIVDKKSFNEYKADYGPTIVTAYAKIGGMPVGIVANQRKQCKTGKGEIEVGGVLYTESADKAARFVMDCNQTLIPIIFLQDVVGFMVGKKAEESGIIRSGAKLVNAVSNSVVPKITIVIGNSFGAGNYALCGKAYDPHFMLAWPNAKLAVMGAEQASNTLFTVQQKAAEKKGVAWDKEEAHKRREKIKETYLEHMDIRYAAARGWVDAIIAPHTTRDVLIHLLSLVKRRPVMPGSFHTGVIQT